MANLNKFSVQGSVNIDSAGKWDVQSNNWVTDDNTQVKDITGYHTVIIDNSAPIYLLFDRDPLTVVTTNSNQKLGPGVHSVRIPMGLAAPTTDEIVTNGTFETNLADWTNVGMDTFALDSDNVPSGGGTYSAKMIVGDSTDRVELDDVIVAGVTHQISFDYKTTSDGFTIREHVSTGESGDTLKTVPHSAEWTNYSDSISLTSNTSSGESIINTIISFYAASASQTIWIDNVSIKRVLDGKRYLHWRRTNVNVNLRMVLT